MATRAPLEVWEPTYKMKPSTSEMFIPVQVESIIKEVVDSKIRDHPQYEENVCRVKCQEISKTVMSRVKELNLTRYKYVIQCVMGEVQGQAVFAASRCLWDAEVDSYASYNFKNGSLFCVVMVFGVYTE